MTVKKAIQIAMKRIMANEEYIEGILKYDKENPDISDNQIGTRITRLVVYIVSKENELLKEIIDQISKPKQNDSNRKAKPLRH